MQLTALIGSKCFPFDGFRTHEITLSAFNAGHGRMAPWQLAKVAQGRIASIGVRIQVQSPVLMRRCDPLSKTSGRPERVRWCRVQETETKLNELYKQIEARLKDDADTKSDPGRVPGGIGREESNYQLQRDLVEVLFSRFAA